MLKILNNFKEFQRILKCQKNAELPEKAQNRVKLSFWTNLLINIPRKSVALQVQWNLFAFSCSRSLCNSDRDCNDFEVWNNFWCRCQSIFHKQAIFTYHLIDFYYVSNTR